MGFMGVNFVDCKSEGMTEMDFAKYAPAWRRATKGINILGYFI